MLDFNNAPSGAAGGEVPPEPDKAALAAYLDVVFGWLTGMFAFRGFTDQGSGYDGRPYNEWIDVDRPDFVEVVYTMLCYCARHGTAAYCIPGTVRERGQASAAHVQETQVLLADIDAGDITAKLEHAVMWLGEPSLVIESGGRTGDGQDKLHVYWKLTEPLGQLEDDLEQIRKLRHALAVKIGADTHFQSMHQPIRLPGSVYHKGARTRLVSIRSQSAMEYELADLAEAVEGMPALTVQGGGEFDFNQDPSGARLGSDKAFSGEFHAGGDGDETRWNALSTVIGSEIKSWHEGRVTKDDAWQRVYGYNQARIRPPWPDSRLRREFDALAKKHTSEHGPAQEARTGAPLKVIHPADWEGKEVPERGWIVQDLIPLRNVTMLSGDGGLGKSQIALQLLIDAAAQKMWLGRPTMACKGLGVFCEDDEDELHRRTFWTCAQRGIDLTSLGDLELVSRVGLNNELVEFNAQGRGDPVELYSQILTRALDFGVRLVVLDSLHDLFSGNENSRPQARLFISFLRHIAIAIDGAVLLTAHPSLSGRNTGTGEAGSTAWGNAVRSRLYLTEPVGEGLDSNCRILTSKKANYAAKGECIECEWREGVFVPIGTHAKSAQANKAEEVFLACLDKLANRNTRISESPSSPAYAPKAMKRLEEAKNVSKRDLERAMDALFSSGTIINRTLGPPSRRRHVIARAESAS